MFTSLQVLIWLVSGVVLCAIAFVLTVYGESICEAHDEPIEDGKSQLEIVRYTLNIILGVICCLYAFWLCIRAVQFVRDTRKNVALQSVGRK